MTPEQILQINEQMAKICGYEYTIKRGSIIVKQKGSNCAEYFWYPNVDWNHLIEVYSACKKILTSFSRKQLRSTGTKENSMKYFIVSFLDHGSKEHGACIEYSYHRLASFISHYKDYQNELPAPGTQSPSGSIPNGRG